MSLVVHPKKIDLGCGPRKKEGYWGVDLVAFPGVDQVVDLRQSPWPWKDSSVDEAFSSHFIEHLTNWYGRWERVTFFNELYRVMIPNGKVTLVFPHWSSNRAHGDPTHAPDLISELTFYYLDPAWREKEAPHTDIAHNPNGYSCNWHCQWGYGMHPTLLPRSQEYRQHAMEWYKEAIVDMHVTMTARK